MTEFQLGHFQMHMWCLSPHIQNSMSSAIAKSSCIERKKIGRTGIPYNLILIDLSQLLRFIPHPPSSVLMPSNCSYIIDSIRL